MTQPVESRRTPSVTISRADVESEVERLFGKDGVVVRVLGDDQSREARDQAFTELLSSLAMYGYTPTQTLTVDAPTAEDITRALAVLGQARLQRELFHRVLTTFGGRVVDPLVGLLDTTAEGLRARMNDLRQAVLGHVGTLPVSSETAFVLREDLRRVLTDDYLDLLAEHEEKIQRPLASELAHEVLHLVGTTFRNAFRSWPEHARAIGEGVARRLGGRVPLRTSPSLIRDRIVEGVEDFLWVETSNELDGALKQLLAKHQWSKLVDKPVPTIDRDVYREFAEACWHLISNHA